MNNKKKQELLQQELEEKKQKAIETRINIKRTLSLMKNKSKKLDEYKKDYIKKAQDYLTVGNSTMYNMTKTGLKNCLSKQRFLDNMVANLELSLQISDMNNVVTEFVKGMNLIAESMKSVTSTFDMSKAQLAYETALSNNAGQYEALDSFMEVANQSLSTISDGESNVTDEEIDKLISVQTLDAEDSLDKEIDEKISTIKEKMTESI